MQFTRLAKRVFDVPIALVSIIDESRQWFKSRQGLDATETSREISFCGHAILDHQCLVVENALEDNRFKDNPLVLGNPNIRFYAGYPLATPSGHHIGTLCVIDSKPRKMSGDDVKSLMDMGKVIEEELKLMTHSVTDELTGLWNRRGFNQVGNYLLKNCERMKKNAILLNIDLDKFKLINDTYGHASGDKALKIAADLLQKSFRSSDARARMGGDEFCVLCTDVSYENINALLRRLENNIKEFNHSNSEPFSLFYSIGDMAYEPLVHDSLEDLIRDADTLMYQQKSA